MAFTLCREIVVVVLFRLKSARKNVNACKLCRLWKFHSSFFNRRFFFCAFLLYFYIHLASRCKVEGSCGCVWGRRRGWEVNLLGGKQWHTTFTPSSLIHNIAMFGNIRKCFAGLRESEACWGEALSASERKHGAMWESQGEIRDLNRSRSWRWKGGEEEKEKKYWNIPALNCLTLKNRKTFSHGCLKSTQQQ